MLPSTNALGPAASIPVSAPPVLMVAHLSWDATTTQPSNVSKKSSSTCSPRSAEKGFEDLQFSGLGFEV